MGDATREAFSADLRDCRACGIGRVPTFIVDRPGGSRLVVGYRPLELTRQVFDAAR